MAVQDTVHDPIFVNDPIPCPWWSIFHDEQLSNFIEVALGNNPTVQEAEAKIALACAQSALIKSSLFPQINWGADVLREKFSETGVIPFNSPTIGITPLPATGGQAGIPVYFTQYETEFTLYYDFDIWQKNRNAWIAAVSEVEAKRADAAFTRLTLSIAVAATYYQLQMDYKRYQVIKALVENQKAFASLNQNRLQNSLNQVQSVISANAAVKEAEYQLIQIQGDIAVTENKLRAYLAKDFLDDIYIAELPLPLVPLPQCLPLHLLARRPDINAELWHIQSAGKQIEVARAGFYPDFDITALFGWQTIHFSKLFNWPSSMYSVDPAVTLPIFDGGRLTANLRGSEANYDLAIFRYNELVINAVKEVLDGIALVRNAEQLLQNTQDFLQDVDARYQLTGKRVQNGLDSDLTYLTIQKEWYTAQDREIVAHANTLQTMIALIKAVGG